MLLTWCTATSVQLVKVRRLQRKLRSARRAAEVPRIQCGDHHGAELLFQIIIEREERAAVAIGTNLPFSEWGTIFPDPRPDSRH